MKSYRFDQYVQDASIDPFVLEVSDDPADNIVIQAPDGETMLKLEESRSSRDRLKLFLGKEHDRAWEHLSTAPGGALAALVLDMAGHFGMNFQKAPLGGTGASSS